MNEIQCDAFIYRSLIEEIGQRDKENPNQKGQTDYKKTSLVPFMTIFDEFVKGIEKKRRDRKSVV